MRVVVIGAGITGASAAYDLAGRGASVIVLDRYGPAAMASGWSLAGVRQTGRHLAELPLARAAVSRWGTLAEELDGTTHYRRDGNIRLALTDDEIPVLEAIVAEQSAEGLDIRMLRGAEVRACAPAVSETVVAATFCPTDGHADPIATVESFIAAARRRGATMRFGERALSIEVAGGRVRAVVTDKERIETDAVILAAGIFGNELLDPLGLHVPIDVQTVAVVQTAPYAPTLKPVIGMANFECAGRQEADGRFRATTGIVPWFGQIVPGPRPVVHPTVRAIGEVIRTFTAVVPAFGEAGVERTWAGLIDQTPDALPVLDRAPGIEGLAIGMGFSGHGFCLGPVSGRILADLISGNGPDLPIGAFQLSRFDQPVSSRAPLTLGG